MHGERTADNVYTIRVDQGLDTTAFSPAFAIDADLVETQYIIELDNRFGVLTDAAATMHQFLLSMMII
jgi:hypothetical protein